MTVIKRNAVSRWPWVDSTDSSDSAHSVIIGVHDQYGIWRDIL